MSRVLVVANVTATSRQLIDALKEHAAGGSCSFTLLVPAKSSGEQERASERLEESVARMQGEGLEVDEARLAESDPVAAAVDAWKSEGFDTIVVSTLPPESSKWLKLDLPQRLEKETGATVTHVIATGSDSATFDRPSGSA